MNDWNKRKEIIKEIQSILDSYTYEKEMAGAIADWHNAQLSIVLPEKKSTYKSPFTHDGRDFEEGYNEAIDACKQAIEKAGFKVEVTIKKIEESK